MLIPDTMNSPRLCYAGGRVFFVRRISLESLGILLNWLDDVLPGERTELPKLNDPESQKALRSWPGIVLQVWLALREHGVSYEDTAERYAVPIDSDDEQALIRQFRLLDCLFGRRKTAPKDEEAEPGEDISKSWCAKGMARLAAKYGIAELGKLSTDQYQWLASEGELDEHARYGDLKVLQEEFQQQLPDMIKLIEAAKAAGTIESIRL